MQCGCLRSCQVVTSRWLDAFTSTERVSASTPADRVSLVLWRLRKHGFRRKLALYWSVCNRSRHGWRSVRVDGRLLQKPFMVSITRITCDLIRHLFVALNSVVVMVGSSVMLASDFVLCILLVVLLFLLFISIILVHKIGIVLFPANRSYFFT